MSPHEFVQKLKSRYPDLNDKPIIIRDIEDGLSNFSAANIEKLFDLIINEYTYSSTPKWAHINKLAREFRIGKHSSSQLKDAYNVCQVCNTAYSLEGKKCPKCHKITPIVIHSGEKPKNFYESREDCGDCKHYMTDGAYGPVCPEFGSEMTQKGKQCKTCDCRRCCFETFAINEALNSNPRFYDRITDWEDRRRV